MINHTEYWEMRCDKCRECLRNPEDGGFIFHKFDKMLNYAKKKGWTFLAKTNEHFCEDCAIKRNIELNLDPYQGLCPSLFKQGG